MSQWTVHHLPSEPGVEFLLRDAELNHYLPNPDAAPGAADWRELLYPDLNQILTRQNLLDPLPAGVAELHRLQHQAFLVGNSQRGKCLGRGAKCGRRRLQMRKPAQSFQLKIQRPLLGH